VKGGLSRGVVSLIGSSRRAGGFEYGVRMVAFDAFKLVRGLVDRVGSVLPGVKSALPELGRGDAQLARGTVGDPPLAAVTARPERTGDRLDSERLDAALARLRATTPRPTEDE
jgi:hypothetical protein